MTDATTTPDHGDLPDADRRLALLWDPPQPSGRGRKARLSLADVVTAGTAVARGTGLEALSMRKVATHLGVGAMTLYTYVPGRTELIDLMVDRAFAELNLPAPDLPWREATSRYAREHLELYLRHPWLLQVNRWRMPLGPHVLDAEEAGLRALDAAGLQAAQVVEVIGLIDTYVHGVARGSVAERSEGKDTGLSNDGYWDSMSAFWGTYFDPDRYPTMTRVWEAGGFDAGHAGFDRTLARLLDGVELAIDRG